MYAERELKRLDEVKAVLRRRIARRRAETIAQTVRVTKTAAVGSTARTATGKRSARSPSSSPRPPGRCC